MGKYWMENFVLPSKSMFGIFYFYFLRTELEMEMVVNRNSPWIC